MNPELLIDDARHLLGDADPQACNNLTAALQDSQAIATHNFVQPQHLVCIDGAVASTQTDVLVWTAAVAGNSGNDDIISYQLVSGVSSATDRLRSAAMALCEMRMALQAAESAGEVWMDGSLTTPLLSVSTAISGANEAIADTLANLLERTSSMKTIESYIELAKSGNLRALPKQDTATGFAEDWSELPILATSTQNWVAERNDHVLARGVLKPGEYLLARRAREALRVKIRTTEDMPPVAREWADALDPLLRAWRTSVSAHVTYAMPHVGTGRPVKIEYTTSNGEDAHNVARSVVETACSHIAGVQVVEPLPQFLVDATVKKQVTTDMLDMMRYAHQQLGGHFPEAVKEYRS